MAPKPDKQNVRYRVDSGSSIFLILQAAKMYELDGRVRLIEVCSSNNTSVQAIKTAGADISDTQMDKMIIDMSKVDPNLK